MSDNRADWHKSSYSAGAQNCVEVREDARGVDIRDTQHMHAGYLSIPAREWLAFLHGVQAGGL